MPLIRFREEKNISPIECSMDSNLMEVLLSSDVPVASSCLSNGICGKCKIQVLAGGDSLGAETELEQSLKKKYALDSNWRISCQTIVKGDLIIDAPYW